MLKIVEMFSGLGAWSKSLERLNINHELIAFSELDPYAIKAYCALYNESEMKNIGDITKFDEDLGEIDLFFFSPPCQNFSLAGKQEGFETPRGVLFFDALRLIQKSKPKYCIMENVKGLTSKKFKSEFKSMLESLNSSGYNNYYKVVNAKELGIPQNRERVFIISIRKDIDTGKFEFPESISLKKTLSDIIEDDAELPILHNIYGGFGETKPRVFTEYAPTIRTSSRGGHIPSICLKNRGKIIEKKDNIASCLDANYFKGLDNHAQRTGVIVNEGSTIAKSKHKLIDGKTVRTLTTLETIRLMDFDDSDWTTLKNIGLSDTRIYKLCGNSIVVNVISEILKQLFKAQDVNV